MRLYPLVVAVFAAFLSVTLPAVAEDCRKEAFSEEPQWAIGAAWSAATDRELLVSDSRKAQVFAFYKDGRRARSELADKIASRMPPSRRPIVIKRQGSNQFLQLTGNRFVRFVRDGQSLGSGGALDLTGPKLNDGVEVDVGDGRANLVTVHDWAPAGSDLVLLGDLYLQDDSLSQSERKISGVVRLELSDDFSINRAYVLGDDWRFDSPEWHRHRVLLNMLAGADTGSGELYFLRQGDNPRIYVNHRGSTSLVPLGDLTAERLGAPGAPLDVPDVNLLQITLIMAKVEEATLVSGIYWWDQSLYALRREPKGEIETRWTLIKIDPQSGAILGESELPTTANHLLVAPGETWAFVEKGRYWALGHQAIPGAYFIEDALLQQSLAARQPVPCRR